MVEVFAIKLMKEKDYLEIRAELLLLFPKEQAIKIQRFKRSDDEQRSMMGELLTSQILSKKTGTSLTDLEITKSEKGKPSLLNNQNIQFNISHSGQWVVAAFAEKAVGIDVEELKEPAYRIAERYFSKTELENLNRLTGSNKQAYFFDLWTLKESYLKLLGKGLTKSLGSFTVSGGNGSFDLIEGNRINEGINFKQYKIDPLYKISVCSSAEDFNNNIQELTVEQLLKSKPDGS